MPPTIAAAVCLTGIVGLFWLDRGQKVRNSVALWIPVIWLLVVCSRPLSQWLQLTTPTDSSDVLLEGSPSDRLFFVILLVIAIVVLIGRSRQVGQLLRANGPVTFFFCYCALTLMWSDYPGVAFKRWIKLVGDLAVTLIVLTEREPRVAFERLLARLSYLLIPISILLMKYYPQLGMGWNAWTGAAVYTGVTTNKNSLGAVCLLLGLGTLWRLVIVYKDREDPSRSRRMVPLLVILAMVLWLFRLMDAKTALMSFLIAGFLLLAANHRAVIRRPGTAHLLTLFFLTLIVAVVFFGIDPDALKAIGRNSTLTERTDLWASVLSLVRNPVFGTGFESFWLGPRLTELWRVYPWRPNEAHDGYLEIFLNLGWVGVSLLAIVLITGYRRVFDAWKRHLPLGDIRLAYFFVGLVFNFTEAAFFRITAPVWIFFLFAIMCVPEIRDPVTQSAAQLERAGPPVYEQALSAMHRNTRSWPPPAPAKSSTSLEKRALQLVRNRG